MQAVDTKAYNQNLLLDEAEQNLTKQLIQVSEMVDTGKLSSTGAKQVAGVIIQRHRVLKQQIKELCK
jgi:Asp-tRNA(Asn)/Glu-tRNA(Gln) amidotransferase B subunit